MPDLCLCVTPEKADTKALYEFQTRLEEFSRTGEDIGMPFLQISRRSIPIPRRIVLGLAGPKDANQL
jgi:hypothetical protein